MRWIQHPETLELIPADQYVPPSRASAHIWPDLPDYVSPVTGKLISGRKQRAEDLKRAGARPYEGREQEAKEAARQRAYEEARFTRKIEEGAAHVLSHMSTEARRILDRQ